MSLASLRSIVNRGSSVSVPYSVRVSWPGERQLVRIWVRNVPTVPRSSEDEAFGGVWASLLSLMESSPGGEPQGSDRSTVPTESLSSLSGLGGTAVGCDSTLEHTFSDRAGKPAHNASPQHAPCTSSATRFALGRRGVGPGCSSSPSTTQWVRTRMKELSCCRLGVLWGMGS